MFYVYVLLQNNGNLYTGYSEDVKRRIKEHQEGKVASTRNNRPLKLVLYEGYLFEEDARRREKYLKTSDGKRDIKRQLSFVFDKLKVN
jgi:putative endonuclease